MKLMELSRISQKMSMCFIFGVPSWLYTILHSVLWRVLQNFKRVQHLYEKYKIKINSNDYLESNFPYDNRKCIKRHFQRLLVWLPRECLTLHLLLFEQSM